MAKTLYAPLNGVSDKAKKILVSTGGLSNYVVKGYCSVDGLSKQFWGASQPHETLILWNGYFTEVTSPNCRTRSIVYGGDFGRASDNSNSVITNKNLGWFREYSQTASYPWTFQNILPPISAELVSGNIKNITGISDEDENLLSIPVIGSMLNVGSVGTEIGGKIVITMKATDTAGLFVMGVGKADLYIESVSSAKYFFNSMIKKNIYFNSQTQNAYPLNEWVYVEMELTNNNISYLKNNLYQGYWFLFVGAPPNFGYTPKVYITSIKYVDLT